MAKDQKLEVWAKDMEDGSRVVGLFNGCDRAGAKDYAAFPGFFSLEPS